MEDREEEDSDGLSLQFDRVMLDWISNGDRKQEGEFT